MHSHVDIGIAVDTDDGLFVPALRNCRHARRRSSVRADSTACATASRTAASRPEELTGYTILLSNFGVFAGQYATPVVVPPCVCIVGAGRAAPRVMPVMGGIETHRMMPLSLTFDHRAVTGGEAARFLRAMIDDLQRPELTPADHGASWHVALPAS